jgi:hypothetical protein
VLHPMSIEVAAVGCAARAVPGIASAYTTEVCANYSPDDHSVWNWSTGAEWPLIARIFANRAVRNRVRA